MYDLNKYFSISFGILEASKIIFNYPKKIDVANLMGNLLQLKITFIYKKIFSN